VAKTQAKQIGQKKLSQKKASTKNSYVLGTGNLENPELAEDAPLADIRASSTGKYQRPLTELAEVQTSEALLEKKYIAKGMESPSKLREETERMEKEFDKIMQDLERKKATKDMGWYQEQLDADYASMRKNLEGSTTGSLVRKKAQNLRDQQAEIAFRTQVAIAEAMRKGSSKELEKGRFKLDKTYERLAEQNPLDFIEAVLANHPQEN